MMSTMQFDAHEVHTTRESASTIWNGLRRLEHRHMAPENVRSSANARKVQTLGTIRSNREEHRRDGEESECGVEKYQKWKPDNDDA